jgi:hypothetical protein
MIWFATSPRSRRDLVPTRTHAWSTPLVPFLARDRSEQLVSNRGGALADSESAGGSAVSVRGSHPGFSRLGV